MQLASPEPTISPPLKEEGAKVGKKGLYPAAFYSKDTMRETNDTSYGGYQRWVPVELPNALRSCRATSRGDHNS